MRFLSRTQAFKSFISGLDEHLLGDEDSIEELSLILAVSDLAGLADLGAREGEGSVVDTVEDKLVLDLLGEGNGGASEHVNVLVLLATQEVLDSERRTVLGDDDVNGEMSVHESHLVAEALNIDYY